MTCGRDNVRMWRLKNGKLNGLSIRLGSPDMRVGPSWSGHIAKLTPILPVYCLPGVGTLLQCRAAAGGRTIPSTYDTINLKPNCSCRRTAEREERVLSSLLQRMHLPCLFLARTGKDKKAAQGLMMQRVMRMTLLGDRVVVDGSMVSAHHILS